MIFHLISELSWVELSSKMSLKMLIHSVLLDVLSLSEKEITYDFEHDGLVVWMTIMTHAQNYK